MRRTALAVLAGVGIAGAAAAQVLDERFRPRGERGSGDVFRPEVREPTRALIAGLKVPPGFRVTPFASGLEGPRMLAAAGPAVYVTQPAAENVLLLRDRDGDGAADEKRVAAAGIEGVHGIAIQGGRVWLAQPTAVLAGRVRPDGSLGELEEIAEDLPPGGDHPHRTVGLGPDGMLYVSVGSSCNACVERDPEHATLLRLPAAGGKREVFARGLRNTIGFAWHPETRELWGFDHGSDRLGDDVPPEELNRIQKGEHYGWPWVWGDGHRDRRIEAPPPPRTQAPALGYQAHAAPIAFVFYTGKQFPAEYRGDAFAAMHGSWNRREPVGYRVVRVRFERGKPTRVEDFLTGFLVERGRATFGRPAGLAVAPDGALLVSDDAGGMIYRVAHGR